MFDAVLKTVKSIKFDEISSPDLLTLSPEFLPEEYSLTALDITLLADNEMKTLLDKFERFHILNACLCHAERLQEESPNAETIYNLTSKISRLILPDGNRILSDEVSEVEKQNSLYLTRHIANFGFASLSHLSGISGASKIIFKDQDLLSVLTFTLISDPWTTPYSLKTAEDFLYLFSAQTLDPEFITNVVLASFVRPLFSSASVPKAITTSGRAAGPSIIPPEPHDFSAWDSTSKPWRLDTCYTLTVFSWAIKHASHETILASFHLIIPPILILLDSPKTRYQIYGLRILVPFLQKVTPTLLKQTGLGMVIEDAIYPTLLSLPPITPAADSISILPPAYEALFVLFETRFPACTLTGHKPRLAYLARIFRHAIVPCHQNTTLSSTPNTRIEEISLIQLSRITRLQGVYCIAHLNLSLIMVSDSLLNPFVTASLPTMAAAVGALREIILCAWPRIAEEARRRTIIKIIASAWKEIRATNESKEAAEVREDLKVVGKLFSHAVQALRTCDFSQEMRPLFEVDSSLNEVFGISLGQAE